MLRTSIKKLSFLYLGILLAQAPMGICGTQDMPVNQVLEIASKLLIVAGVFQLFDGIQAVVLGALRGMQDVNKPAVIIFLSYGVIGFPISYYLGFYTILSMVGIWLGLLSGLFSFISSLSLFLSSDETTMLRLKRNLIKSFLIFGFFTRMSCR